MFVFHEAWLVNESLVQAVAPFRTPLGIWQQFWTTVGEQSLVAAIRKGVSAPGAGLESQFALRDAEFRDQHHHDIKAQTLIDLLWSGLVSHGRCTFACREPSLWRGIAVPPYGIQRHRIVQGPSPWQGILVQPYGIQRQQMVQEPRPWQETVVPPLVALALLQKRK